MYEEGRRKSAETVQIFFLGNDLNRPRFGVSVSRRFGGAVRRNLWKRWLREAFRRNRERLATGFDIVAQPRLGERSPDFRAIKRDLDALLGSLTPKREIGHR
ncbi:MAG: ribonuclease P protein component [Acidobacteriota bacterium]